MKIGIIGAGSVAAAVARSLVQPGGLNPDIVIIDAPTTRRMAWPKTCRPPRPCFSGATCRSGDYAALDGASLVIVTAGVNETKGCAKDRNDPEGRRKPGIRQCQGYGRGQACDRGCGAGAVILVVTDPPNSLAEVVRALAPTIPSSQPAR